MMCGQAGPKQLVRDVTLAKQAGFDSGSASSPSPNDGRSRPGWLLAQ
jgi:hypothetical protein